MFADNLPDIFSNRQLLRFILLGTAGLLAILTAQLVPWLLRLLTEQLFPTQGKEAYQQVVQPYNALLSIVSALAIADIVIMLYRPGKAVWLSTVEISVGLVFSFSLVWLLTRFSKQFFDVYLIDLLFKGGRKVNSELFIVGQFLTNATIVVTITLLFAQTHQVNVIGLIASLGVGGIAIAFAAQKTLEQILGGLVLYIDRPFNIDDYVSLPDGTFGRVESIGLRSTRIRTSGKGTIMVVPNNVLTQTNIENFTGAKKVLSIFNIDFPRVIPDEEQALIRQVILESTNDILGMDTQNTDVSFRSSTDKSATAAQITFFILGSNEVSLELRRQLLGIAKQNLTKKLKGYGISFEMSESPINVDMPINV